MAISTELQNSTTYVNDIDAVYFAALGRKRVSWRIDVFQSDGKILDFYHGFTVSVGAIDSSSYSYKYLDPSGPIILYRPG